MREDKQDFISREIILEMSAGAHRVVDDIKDAFPALQSVDILDLALNKLTDAEGIWQRGCQIVGVDEDGVVGEILRRKMPDVLADAEIGQKTKAMEPLLLTVEAEQVLDGLKLCYQTDSDEKIWRLALDTLERIIDMRERELAILGLNAKGAIVFEIGNDLLDAAEEGAARMLRRDLTKPGRFGKLEH